MSRAHTVSRDPSKVKDKVDQVMTHREARLKLYFIFTKSSKLLLLHQQILRESAIGNVLHAMRGAG